MAKTLFSSLSDLYGDGTISTTGGAVLDADFVFDATQGTSQNFAFGSGGTLSVTANGGDLGAGYKQSGSLIISDGVSVTSSDGYLGLHSSSTGTATVTGAGSRWTNTNNLWVGKEGNGTLTVTDGGEVVAKTLFASPSDLHGDGTITATRGAVLDADLVFDAAHGTSKSFAFGSGGTLNITFNGGDLGVGYKQSGSLTISDGVHILSNAGYLGQRVGSMGTAIVSSTGSQWNVSRLNVGYSGYGTLTIEAGGQVSASNSFLGYNLASSGVATVTGTDSQWRGLISSSAGKAMACSTLRAEDKSSVQEVS